MKRFIDGNQMCFTLDTFENLQVSPSVFVPLDDENVKAIVREKSLYAASGAFLVDVLEKLHAAEQSFAPDTACAECQQPYPNHSHTCSLAGS